MNVKLILLFLFLMPLAGQSENQIADDVVKAFPENYVGLPKPNSGVTIVPHKEMTIGLPPAYIKKFALEEKQQKEKGYYEESTKYPAEIMKDAGKPAEEPYGSKSDLMDTHFKKDLSLIKLAFTFKMPEVVSKNVVKYVALGTTRDTGWSGVGIVFNSKNSGACRLSLSSFAATEGGVQFDESTVQYVVNNKPSTVTVYGKEGMGFIYNVSWDDKKFDYNLECASKSYNSNITQNTIALARTIDAQMNK